MRDDIRQGRRTVPELKEMLEKNLSTTYGVSRDTARRARKAVLSESGADRILDKSRQTTNFDKGANPQ
jgi:hypothetical protein